MVLRRGSVGRGFADLLTCVFLGGASGTKHTSVLAFIAKHF